MSKYQKPKFLDSPLATGVVGAIVSLFLFISYAWFKARILPGAGGQLEHPLSWFPLLNFSAISRDYYDVIFILISTVLAMIGWEKFHRNVKLISVYSIFSIICYALFFKIATGSELIISTSTITLLDFKFTRPELVLMIHIICSMLFFSIYASIKYTAIRKANNTTVSWKWAVKSGFWRFLAIFSIITFYTYGILDHPYWKGNNWGNWRISISYIWVISLIFGLPYIILTQKFRASLKEDRSDSGLLLISIYHALWKSIKQLSYKPFINRFHNRKIGIACMDIFVKAFFLPIMLSGVYSELGSLFSNYPNILPRLIGSIDYTFNMIYNNLHLILWIAVMTTDIVIGAIGYACSSRWLGNKSKSVDLTCLGWVACLTCYPPFNAYTGSVFPFKDRFGGPPPEIFLQTPELMVALKIIMLLAFVVFTWSTMSFGLKFSNMTNRGIIKNGPYAIVRHPAYIAKTIGWWAMFIHLFSTPWHFIALATFNGVYFIRALTEEKHLMRDPEYREYAKNVKWRFIPGVF